VTQCYRLCWACCVLRAALLPAQIRHQRRHFGCSLLAVTLQMPPHGCPAGRQQQRTRSAQAWAPRAVGHTCLLHAAPHLLPEAAGTGPSTPPPPAGSTRPPAPTDHLGEPTAVAAVASVAGTSCSSCLSPFAPSLPAAATALAVSSPARKGLAAAASSLTQGGPLPGTSCRRRATSPTHSCCGCGCCCVCCVEEAGPGCCINSPYASLCHCCCCHCARLAAAAAAGLLLLCTLATTSLPCPRSRLASPGHNPATLVLLLLLPTGAAPCEPCPEACTVDGAEPAVVRRPKLSRFSTADSTGAARP
jgi:hypothetical protein